MAMIITDSQNYIDIADAIREKHSETTKYLPNEMADAVRSITDLNFTVIGGDTVPENPKENTIWVNTGSEITSWSFSGEEPSEPAEGMVWIKIGFDKAFDFNAIEENTLTVYPQNAFQYVSGEWVYTESEIYQNGVWNQLYYKPNRIETLNATGWARYSEGVSGEYARIYNGERGFTRSSTLPAIWCWTYNGSYGGVCLVATGTSSLSISSLANGYSSMITKSTTTPNGHTIYYLYMEYATSQTTYTMVSSGTTYTFTRPESDKYIDHTTSVIGGTLGAWIDELLFGEVS